MKILGIIAGYTEIIVVRHMVSNGCWYAEFSNLLNVRDLPGPIRLDKPFARCDTKERCAYIENFSQDNGTYKDIARVMYRTMMSYGEGFNHYLNPDVSPRILYPPNTFYEPFMANWVFATMRRIDAERYGVESIPEDRLREAFWKAKHMDDKLWFDSLDQWINEHFPHVHVPSDRQVIYRTGELERV